jgi:hypothetical protein
VSYEFLEEFSRKGARAQRIFNSSNSSMTGPGKTVLRNLWSEALSSENFQLTTNAHSTLRSIKI